MREKVIKALVSAGFKKESFDSIIEVPKDPKMGDFAIPCFPLAKEMKKNPVEIAKDISSKIKSKDFEKVVPVGPYVNFFLVKKDLALETITKVLKEKDKYGSSNIGKGKNIVIDYSGPNVGKPMHVGHIRSTILGDSIKRIEEFMGFKTLSINHLGDLGLHIGKLIVAWELWLDKKELKKDPTKELLRLYVKFCDQEKSEVQEGMDENEEFEGNEWTEKAKKKLKLIEEGDAKTIKIWKDIIKYSNEGFDRVYKILNIKFEDTSGASRFGDSGKIAAEEALKKGLAKKESDGAVFVEFDSLPKKFILRSNGTASYMTQDIGAAIERAKKYKFDKMIYVTDYRQSLHFQQLFEILDKFGYSLKDKLVHLPFGTVNFGTEIMATRAGKVILLEEVLSKMIEKAKEETLKRKTKGNPEEIAVSAMKYSILKVESVKDVSFSWDKALSFEGDTGPYLLYTYARAKSILKKAKYSPKKLAVSQITEVEKRLISELSKFPELVMHSHSNLSPNLIANYSFELAQTFNEFYHSSQVLGSEEEKFRLSLVDAYSQVLKNALSLLGIKTIEKM